MTYQVYDNFDGSSNSILQVYTGAKKISSTSYVSKCLIWKKPRSAKFIHFLCVGGGGGGGGGSANNPYGGSGGGSGSVISDLIPAILLPDLLYISVGGGGAGGGVELSGNIGGYTLISFIDNGATNANYWASYSNHFINCSPGSGGLSGTNGPGAGGGWGQGISSGYGALGIRSALTGRAGAAVGVDPINFVSQFPGLYSSSSFFVSGGTQGGGAGVSPSSGRSIILGGIYKNILGGIVYTGNNGDDGFNADLDLSIGLPRFRTDNKALFFTGGAGGAGDSGSRAGSGGKGGYGCGGGGGGSSGTAGNCGVGGDGGPGLVIITSIL